MRRDSLDTKGKNHKQPKQRAYAGFYGLMPLEVPCQDRESEQYSRQATDDLSLTVHDTGIVVT